MTASVFMTSIGLDDVFNWIFTVFLVVDVDVGIVTVVDVDAVLLTAPDVVDGILIVVNVAVGVLTAVDGILTVVDCGIVTVVDVDVGVGVNAGVATVVADINPLLLLLSAMLG